MPASGADDLANVHVELQDAVAIVHLARPAKRNALNDETVFSLERWFSRPPEQVKAVVLVGDGDHFCAGLDLSELKERSVAEGMLHSRSWHKAFEPVEFGAVPVVAVLHGAVVGGGLDWPPPRISALRKRQRSMRSRKAAAASMLAAARRCACRSSSVSRA
jgi:(methylthio)acryloyl-CoA hydratase